MAVLRWHIRGLLLLSAVVTLHWAVPAFSLRTVPVAIVDADFDQVRASSAWCSLLALRQANSTLLAAYNLSLATQIHAIPNTEPKTVAETVNQALSTSPVALLGPSYTQPASIAGYIAEPRRVPRLSNLAAGDVVTSFAHLFKATPSQNLLVRQMVDLCLYFGWQQIATIYHVGDFGLSFVNDLRAEIAHRSNRVAIVASASFGTLTELDNALQTIKNSNVRVIVDVSGNQMVNSTLSKAAAMGMMEGYVWMTPALGESLGVGRDSVFSIVPGGSVPVEPQFTEFQNLLSGTTPEAPFNTAWQFVSVPCSFGFDMGWALARALAAASVDGQETNQTRVTQELRRVEHPGLYGPVSFDATGYVKGGTVLTQRQNGVTVRVGFIPHGQVSNSSSWITPATAANIIFTGGYNYTHPPTSYVPDTCGVFHHRDDQTGACLACPADTINDASDGLEVCAACTGDLVLQRGACLPCPASQSVGVDINGVRTCTQVSRFDTSILLYLGIALVLTLVCFFVYHHVRGLKRTARQAAERVESEKALVNVFFHELRNPMNGVVGYLDMAAEELEPLRASGTHVMPKVDLKAVLNDLRQAQSCARHTVDVLNRVLDFGRLAAGTLQLESSPTKLKDVSEGVRRVCIATVKPGVNVVAEYHGVSRDELVHVDSYRLSEVLVNLMTNSAKFTMQGCITLGIERLDNEKGSNFLLLRFSVADTGCGISEAGREFLMANNVNAEYRGKGSGIGVFICKAILAKMGSKLEFHSPLSPQGGSRFWFDVVLPRVTEDDAVRVRIHTGVNRGMDPVVYSRSSPNVQTRRLGNSSPSVSTVRIVSPRDGSPTHAAQNGSGPAGTPASAPATPPTEQPLVIKKSSRRRRNRIRKRKQSGVVVPMSREESHHALSDIKANGYSTTTSLLSSASLSDIAASTAKPMHGDTPSQPPPGGLRVLVADDLRTNRSLLMRLLTRGPFKGVQPPWDIIPSATGVQTRDLLVKSDTNEEQQKSCAPLPLSGFHIVLLDQNMGDHVLGSHLVSELRRRGDSRTIVVLCSGNCTEHDKEMYLKAGADLVWGKPVPRPCEMWEQLAPLWQLRFASK